MFDLKAINDIVLLIWIGIAAIIAKNAKKNKIKVLGKEEERYTLFFAIIVFLPLFWFVTTVYVRSDMYLYWSGFDSFNQSVSQVLRNWNWDDKGPGYGLICAIAKSIGINEFQQFRVLIALLHSVPLVLVYWRYSEDYVYSVFLFIANMSYDSWMMNGMRQFIAASIILAAFPLLLRKKYIFVALLVFVAITIHKSAIVMIPVLILVQFKPWSKLFILSLITFGVILYIYVFNSDWISEETLQNDDGANPIRILISGIPSVLAFVGRKQIATADNKVVNVLINMSLVTVIMFTVASISSGIMTGRLPGYTTIYNFILYPYLLKKVFNETVSKNLRFGITSAYIAYFILDLYFI